MMVLSTHLFCRAYAIRAQLSDLMLFLTYTPRALPIILVPCRTQHIAVRDVLHVYANVRYV